MVVRHEREEVERLRRAATDEHLAWLGAVDQARDLLARRLEGAGRLPAQLVPLIDAGILVRVDLPQALDHHLRFLTRRSAVEVDERLPVHLALEHGEVAADLVEVERHRRR